MRKLIPSRHLTDKHKFDRIRLASAHKSNLDSVNSYKMKFAIIILFSFYTGVLPQGKVGLFHLFIFSHLMCFSVEYVDIRGSTAGKGTTLPFFQGQDREFLHTDSTFTGCEFKPNVSSAVASEDNFGLYSDVNVKFRCTAGDYSTTQWWFGGYLTK